MPIPKPTQAPHARPVGIKGIAEALGVSIGTVDRALHGRRGISPVTRMKVMNLAQALGYRPNLAARFLSSQREVRVGVSLPREIAAYFDLLRVGILDAAKPFEPNGVTIVCRSHRRLGEGELSAFEELLEEGVHAMIIVPGYSQRLRPLVRKAARRGIPVVCAATDAPGTERLAAVTVDPYVCGAMVGELMGRFLLGKGQVILATGLLAAHAHAQKMLGFREVCQSWYPGIKIAGVIESHDDERAAYRQCEELLARNRDINGIYISTANSLPVIQAVGDAGLEGKVTVIATDLFPALIQLIECGKVTATIDQRPYDVGWLSFQTVHRFLVEGVCPAPVIKLTPHLVIRSNLEVFQQGGHAGFGARTESHGGVDGGGEAVHASLVSPSGGGRPGSTVQQVRRVSVHRREAAAAAPRKVRDSRGGLRGGGENASGPGDL